jgi:hypothetical protein
MLDLADFHLLPFGGDLCRKPTSPTLKGPADGFHGAIAGDPGRCPRSGGALRA